MDLKQAVITISDNPDLLKKLRRKGTGVEQRLKKDAEGREYLEALYNAVPYRFYVGQSRVFPAAVAHGLRRSNLVPLDEDCPNCKGKGSTASGLCFNCKGKKIVFVDDLVPIFEILREYDPMVIDPEAQVAQPSVLTEAAASVA